MWKATWQETLFELDGNDYIPSDDFTRNDEIGALFYKDQPASLAFFTAFDMSHQVWRDDSFVKAWPKETLAMLSERFPGQNVLVCSYFTVAPKWRKSNAEISIKALQMGMVVKHFLGSGCESMLGAVRNNKGMNKATFEAGAEPLVQNQKLHGVDVDLVLFERQKLLYREIPKIESVVEKLWQERASFKEENKIKNPLLQVA